MDKIRSYLDLIVWQRAVGFVIQIYELMKNFPRDQKFGLILQVQRAVVSIPSNIAEGQARNTKAVFANHIDIALASELIEITRMLYGLLRRLRPKN